MRFLGYRILTGVLSTGVIGPEASVSKLYWSEYHRVVTRLAIDVLGVRGRWFRRADHRFGSTGPTTLERQTLRLRGSALSTTVSPTPSTQVPPRCSATFWRNRCWAYPANRAPEWFEPSSAIGDVGLRLPSWRHKT